MTVMERQYLRECIEALCKAYSALLHLNCDKAISKSSYGKGDSLYLDAAPEVTIIKTLCENFDPHLPLVIEEIGSSAELRGTEEEVVCFSDPMDRSKILAEFLSKHTGKVGPIFQELKTTKEWESNYGGNIELSGPYGSITAVRHHYILFNVMINYVTGMLYIASDVGVGKLNVSEIFEDHEKTLLKRTKHLLDMLSPISFEQDGILQEDEKKFVTFCAGKTERDKKKYEDNLIASKIFGNELIDQIRENYLIYDEPGGPARILYLQYPHSAGFILSNGEKICEWLGWLAYVKYCWPKLRAYEISFDSSWTRNQILMAPGRAYSILGNHIVKERGLPYKKIQLNISKLKFLDNPSQYRSTILICPEANSKVVMELSIEKYVELRF